MILMGPFQFRIRKYSILPLICFPIEYRSIRKKISKNLLRRQQNFILRSRVISRQAISPQFCEFFGSFHSKISAFGLFLPLIPKCHLAAYTGQRFHPRVLLELHGLFCWYLKRRKKGIITEILSLIAPFLLFFFLHFSTVSQGLHFNNDNSGHGVLDQNTQTHRRG